MKVAVASNDELGKLVEAHGGEIWIDSEPGKGTTVGFYLPKA